MIPGAIYWDTSSLRELPFDMQDAIFLSLRDLCTEYGIAMCVTRLCVNEIVELRREELRKWMERVEAGPAWVREHLGDPVTMAWVRPKGQVLADIEAAVLYERPRAGRSGCIIIAADPDFQGAGKLPDAYGLDLTVVSSAEHAIRLIRDRMADFVKARFQEDEERLKTFLNTRRDEIQDFVRRHASPRGVLRTDKGLGILETVETIDPDSIELVTIESAFAHHLSANEMEAWVDLSSTVNIRARAMVEISSSAQLMWGLERPEGYPHEQLIETKGIMSGSVLARRSDGYREYLDLKLRRFRWESLMSQMLGRTFRKDRDDQ